MTLDTSVLGRPLDHTVLILGMPGTGKTTFAQGLVLRHLKKREGHRFVAWDYVGKWPTWWPGLETLRNVSPEEAAARAIELAPCTLVLDEGDIAYPANNPPPPGSALQEVIMYGRNAKPLPPWRRAGPVALILTARRAADLAPRLRSTANVWFVGRMEEEIDLDWVEKKLGRAARLEIASMPLPDPARGVPAKFLRRNTG